LLPVAGCGLRPYFAAFFMEIARQGIVPIHGLNYKDEPKDAAQWLDSYGDPYPRTGADLDGRVAIDWGLTGVPETFIVDADGTIAFKQIGPVTQEVWEQRMLPKIEELRGRAQQREKISAR
jgi:cytochrome c biogenesis protein CcmG/thiol:disulfide interchange protein DsbE